VNRRLQIAVLAAALVPAAIGATFAQPGARGAQNRGAPNFDVRPSCRESTFPDCESQEQIAREMLVKAWPGYTAQERTECAAEAKQAGPPSYIGWLSCLQINEDVRKFSATEKKQPRKRHESSRAGAE